MDRIAELTPYQVRHLYFCRRHEGGAVVVEEVDGDDIGMTEAELFREYWRLNGLGMRPDVVERLWRERE